MLRLITMNNAGLIVNTAWRNYKYPPVFPPIRTKTNTDEPSVSLVGLNKAALDNIPMSRTQLMPFIRTIY